MSELPMLLAAGTAIPLFCYLLAPFFPAQATSVEKHLTNVGIFAIAAILTAWTAAFTVAIGCIIVMIMKGPAYVADRYPLSDADEPRQKATRTGARPPSDNHP